MPSANPFPMKIEQTKTNKIFEQFYRDLVAELPFILMHPKPEEEEPNPILLERSPGKTAAIGNEEGSNENASNHVTSGNLIQLDG